MFRNLFLCFTILFSQVCLAQQKTLVAPGALKVAGSTYFDTVGAGGILVTDSLKRVRRHAQFTTNSFLYAGTPGTIYGTIAAANGELLIGRTGDTPLKAAPTGTTNQITVTTGPGTLGFGIPNSFTLPGATPTFGGMTLTGFLNLHADPGSALQAATKQYVDAVASGIKFKENVACATTANITLSGEQTIDGVLTSVSRVLVKNQSTGSQNGIYVSAAGAWARSTDMDADAEIPGALTYISAGTTLAGQQWIVTTASPITVGSTTITWSLFFTQPKATLSGTSNQVSLSASGTNVLNGSAGITLSLPQNIHTAATPTFADATFSSLTASRLMASNGSKTVSSVTDLTSWIAGTANQVVSTSDGDGTLTLSLPQDIHTAATPTFADATFSGLTASRLMSTDGSKSLTSVSDLTSWITGTSNQISVANDGDGTITLSTPQAIGTGSSPTFNSLTISGLTPSLPVFTNGSSALTNNAMTGTGSVMMSASPTTTGTLTAAAANFSGAVSTGALSATSGEFSSSITSPGPLIFSSAGIIRRNTSDGSDNSVITINGGGDALDTRGSTLSLYGNEHATLGGKAEIIAGNVSGGDINLYTGGSLRYTVAQGGTHTFATPVSMSSTLGVTGIQTNSATLRIAGGSGSGTYTDRAEIYSDGTNGLVVIGRDGSANDIVLANGAGLSVLHVPTGTITAQFLGAATIGTTLGVTGVATFTAAPILSSTTASRLLATNGSKAIVSTNAHSWVGGDGTNINVNDDGDGTATITTTQDIDVNASPTFFGLNLPQLSLASSVKLLSVNNLGEVGNGTSITPNYTFTSSNNGAVNNIAIANSSNTSGSGAKIHIQNGGTSGGDAYTHFQGGGTSYTLGLSEANDGFYLANSTTLETTSTPTIFKYVSGNWTFEKPTYFNQPMAHSGRSAGTTVTSDLSVSVSPYVEVYVGTRSGTQSYTLPAANAASGRVIKIMNRGTGTITVNRAGSDTIEGSTSYSLPTMTSGSCGYSVGTFHSDGSSTWYVDYSSPTTCS